MSDTTAPVPVGPDAALVAAFEAGIAAAHAEERRSPDQDTAIEHAFVAGVLPDEDRRQPEEVIPVYVAPEPVYEWLRRGDGTEVLYTNGQIEHDRDVFAVQSALRQAIS